ncbi:MAG: hypothetical protein KDC12_09505, partial [Flavobacteriales bacterium]|nr:hypothetical protein [Flavobacteriales bacterium]
MIIWISNSRTGKVSAVLCAILFLTQLCVPLHVLAVTAGPSQPEVQSFTPISTSDMVNPFTGDFNYNIPLLEIGGYPINIAYNSGIGVEQEASWVGLGWNINPGSISRSMRGLPDEFNGDEVVKKINYKPSRTYGLNIGLSPEIFGFETDNVIKVSPSWGFTYNNYTGVGFSQSINLSIAGSMGDAAMGQFGVSLTAGDGNLNIAPSLSLSANLHENEGVDNYLGANFGLNFASRRGLTELTLGVTQTAAHSAESCLGEANGNKGVNRSNSLWNSSMSLINYAFVPTVGHSTQQINASFHGKFGVGIFGADVSLSLSGTYAGEILKDKVTSYEAFGYSHHEDALDLVSSGQGLQDFNRYLDGPFKPGVTPYLPISSFNFDQYTILGNGVGGQFRPHRSQIEFVADPAIESQGYGGSGGFEIDPGNTADWGIDLQYHQSKSNSNAWRNDNEAIAQLEPANGSAPLHEKCYYKIVGELAVDPEMNAENSASMFSRSGKSKPVKFDTGFDGKLRSVLSTVGNVSAPIIRSSRAKRNVAIVDRSSFAQDGFEGFEIIRPDGARYIYGDALLNVLQKEVTFNCADQNAWYSEIEQLIDYDPQWVSVDNIQGSDHYFESTELPPYAHSYLLTEIVTSDYVDADGIPGPSLGDIGGYVKFDYVNWADLPGIESQHYNWRAPYNKAYHSPAQLSVRDDDKASYLYGEKELKYLSTIESKNQVAVFVVSEREDGLEAVQEHTFVGKGSQAMFKLDKIIHFTREEYLKFLLDPESATPIQTVHLKYNYELCSGTPNSRAGDIGNEVGSNGKLTLKEIYFTYGNSKKARFSSYKFDYENNPDYEFGASDVWGTFQPNSANGLTNVEYPYVRQSRTTADQYASAWLLSQVELPSGGVLNIDFEADDYQFVQDHKAMQYCKMLGFVDHPDNVLTMDDIKPDLFDYSPLQSKTFEYMALEISDEVLAEVGMNNMTSPSEILEDVFRPMMNGLERDIQVRCKINTLTAGNPDGDGWEYVDGYVNMEHCGSTNLLVKSLGNTVVGLVRLERVNIRGLEEESVCAECNSGIFENKCAHPISMIGWNYLRSQMPRRAMNLNEPDGDAELYDVLQVMAGAGWANQVYNMVTGPYREMRSRNQCQKIEPSRSWARVNNVTGGKIGGGSRVKRVVMSDSWSNMTESNDDYTAFYGTEYQYKLADGTSSGVASMEPLGCRENPLIVPKAVREELKLVADHHSFVETPVALPFYPAAVVGYSRVEMLPIGWNSLGNSNENMKDVGHTVYEYFTCKDYPVIADNTSIDLYRKKPSVFAIFGIAVKDIASASQGYVVRLNDMNGKVKSIKSYGAGQISPLSGVEYEYFTAYDEEGNIVPDNQQLVIKSDGSIEETSIGVEFDLVNDFRESRTTSWSAGLQFNTATFLIAAVPCIVPTIWPSFSNSMTQLRTAVSTKTVFSRGILKGTRSIVDGISSSVEAVAFDAETGEQILTKSTNEFGDEFYVFSYPAHWSYDGMGQASKNVGARLDVSFNYQAQLDNNEGYFVSGDEVLYSPDTNEPTIHAWVWKPDNSQEFYLIDTDGEILEDSGTAVIVRSGRRNMQGVS